MGTVISDFQTSNAPQFKGKSMSKRRQMAIAAKLNTEGAETGIDMSPNEVLLQKRASMIRQQIEKVRRQSLQKIKPNTVNQQQKQK